MSKTFIVMLSCVFFNSSSKAQFGAIGAVTRSFISQYSEGSNTTLEGHYTTFSGQPTALFGIRRGLVFANPIRFSVGTSAYGGYHVFGAQSNTLKGIAYGYAAFFVEPIIGSTRLSVNIPLQIGYGATFSTDKSNNFVNSERISVLQPGVQINVGLADRFRLSLGTSYKYMLGKHNSSLVKDGLKGASIYLGISWGD